MSITYYISKILQIFYNDDTDYSSIVLERTACRCQLYPRIDEDDENYEQKIDDFIKKDTRGIMCEPIIIYNNNQFNKPLTEQKYKGMLESEVIIKGKQWSDITRIVKVERAGL